MKKNTKRILSLFLTIVMLASCLGTAVFATASADSKFSDISADAPYEKAVEILSQMGVINGYPDGTFGPDKNVTRAEFTAMLMRILNYGSLGAPTAAQLPFTDISDSDSSISWAIPNINTAYGMGIINGYEDSTFRPNNNVAYQEAVKMIVCTLGYTDMDTNVTPWYSNFIAQAARLGITTYASQLGQVETPASRACIAQMLYDSLEAEIVDANKPYNATKKTILSEYLGYTKNIGLISSNGETGLTDPDSNLDPGEVEIYAYEEKTGTKETYTYATKDNDLKNYLGQEIEFYYKTNGTTRNLEVYALTDSKVLTITPELVEPASSSATQIRYYRDGNATTLSSANLDAENVVIYNGKLYGSNAARSKFTTDMLPDVGSIELLDSNDDNKYDVVKIQSYEVYYVSSKVSSSYSIIDDVTRKTDKELVLNVNDSSVTTKIVNTAGKEMSYNAISVGSVVCLARSNDSNGGEVVQTAVVVNDAVTGTISSTKAGRSVTINGTVYEYSAAAPWMDGNSGTQAEPALQDSGSYAKDINGRIVAYKKNSVNENVMYGYIMGIADSSSSFNDSRSVRILAQNGEEEYVVLDTTTRIDGTSKDTVDALVTLLKNAAAEQNNDENTNVTVQQVIKYTTKTSNGEAVLENVYTAASTSKGLEIDAGNLYYYNKTKGNVPMQYNSSAKKLTAGSVSVSVGSAVVFMVPSDRGAYDDYDKVSVSSAFKDTYSYNVEAFDVTTTNTAKVIVCYGQDASHAVDKYTGVSVVAEEVSNSMNEDGQRLDYLIGYTSDSRAKAELDTWLSASSAYTPVLGDIFRMGTDKDGNATIEKSNVIYAVNGSNTYGKESSSTDFYNSTYAMVLGSVAAIDSESISIIPEYLDKTSEVEDITASALNFSIDSFRNARVLKYEYKDDMKTIKAINDVSSDYEGIIKGLTTYNKGVTSPTKVMLYMYDGSIKMFCVLGENAVK